MNMKSTPLTPTESDATTRILCELSLAVLICLAVLAALACLLMSNLKKLTRLRRETRPMAVTIPESHRDEPHVGMSQRSHREWARPEPSGGAIRGKAYCDGLDSPSWRSNRLCG